MFGLIGTIIKTGSDELFLRQKASKRSFRVTAAGVWVNTKREARTPYGQALGAIMDLGLGMVQSIRQGYSFRNDIWFHNHGNAEWL